ncbi:response regulator transcription factor [Devriesea agamarum]|uniref:response regulator transcription factor n=1 Tax=Devriesea agamarum TaxID=472569 RepID=UPI00071DCDB7|nr:response regulator transcription factor [Devriesea agamarum]
MIRLVLADDQDLLREGLAALLGLETDLDIVGQASTCAQTLQVVQRTRPDILLLDVQMPPGVNGGDENVRIPQDGIEVAERMVGSGLKTRVIVLTTFGRPGYLRRTLEAGAAGFMVKDAPVERLVDGIRRVHCGLRVLDPELAAASLSVGISPLSDRETTVLQETAKGGTTAAIAARLYLSEGTVRNHISSAIGKLGVINRAEAVRKALDNGWL